MISKELLSEVLGRQIKIIAIDENKCEIRNSIPFENYQVGVSYKYLNGNKEIRFMPIYELSHRCKEWAFSKRYNVYSLGKWRDSNRDTYLSYSVTIKTFEETLSYAIGKAYIDKFHADTEPEAIFKACEWILNK